MKLMRFATKSSFGQALVPAIPEKDEGFILMALHAGKKHAK